MFTTLQVKIWEDDPHQTNILTNPEITGNWLGLAPIPEGRTMEALETRLEDNSGFLRFIRRALTWMPETRATAKDLLQDPWLTGKKA
jgi:serine/threonine protein kinase